MDENRMNIGTSLVNLISYIKKKWGLMCVNQVFDKLKETRSELYVKPETIKEKDWYPLELVFELWKIYEEMHGDENLSQTFQIGLNNARNLGILGFFLRFLNPGQVMEKAQETWSRYHNSGSLDVIKGDKNAVVNVIDMPANKFFCKEFEGYLHGVGEMTKMKNIKVEHLECKAEGGLKDSFKISWD